MAIQVKPLEASAAKFARNASSAAADYQANALAAAQRWLQNAGQAVSTFQQAITSAGLPQRWARGVQKAGSAKYSRRVEAVGQSRFSEGVGVAQGDWLAGFQPFAQRLAALTLTGRRPRGDASNYNRVREVGQALNAQRLAALGSAA